MRDKILVAADHVFNAALNGLLQGIVLVLLVSLGLLLLTRTNAATRHAIWFLTVLLVVLLIPVHYRVGQPNATRPFFERTEAIESSTLLLPTGGIESSRQAGQDSKVEANLNRGKSFKACLEDAVLWPERDQSPVAAPSKSSSPPLRAGTARAPLAFSKHALNPVFWKFGLPRIFPRPTAAILLGTWAILASIKLTMLVWRLREIRKLKLSSLPPPPGLQDLFLRVREDLQITRPVALRVSTHHSPVVLGFVHPVILLPADRPQGTEITQVENILRHELAHVARWDDWTNLIQHSIRAAFFFHPAVWWASRQLSLEREIACDDSVLNQGTRPRSYALLLANLASRPEPGRGVFAPGVSNNKSQLQTRINMILNNRRNRSPYLARTRLGIFSIAAALAALIALYAAPRLVLAQAAAPYVPVQATQPPQSSQIAPTPEQVPTVVPAAPEVVDSEPPDAGTPSTPPPAEVPPGAKYRPDDALSEDIPPPTSRPHAPRPPRPPKHRRFAAGPKTPEPAETPDPVVGADSPRAPEARNENLSIEERLARLEKMVRSLMRHQNLGEPRPHEGDGAEENEIVQNELKRVKEMAQRQTELASEQAKRAVAEKQEAELAAEQANRAVAQAKREAELHARGIEGDTPNATPEGLDEGKNTLRHHREFLRDGANKDFEALQKEHERLEKEMERLNREMERLQRDKERKEAPATP